MSTAEFTVSRGALFAALAKAQAKIRNASKDSKNPHFNSKYADLASVAEACREALTENGICVLQDPSTDGNQVRCVTTLGHASGESFESRPLAMVPRDLSPQSVGSCVTYLRRYQLASVVGVAPDDDDGNAAQNGGGFPKGEAGGGASALRGESAKPARADTVKHTGDLASDAQVARLAEMAKAAGTYCEGGCAIEVQQFSKRAGKPLPKTKLCTYHAQLAAFKKSTGEPCGTPNELSVEQAANLLGRYEAKLARRELRAADVPDIAPKKTLQEAMAAHMEGEEADGWIHSTFGVSHVQELDKQQAEDAFALLATFGDPDKFDVLETKLRTMGRIR